MNVYPNLAGFVTDYRDGGLAVPPPPATTDTVLLLGTARDGPDTAPTVITNQNNAPQMYGEPDSPDGKATLVPSIVDCSDAGGTTIHAMRIGGDYSALPLKAATGSDTGYVTLLTDIDFDIPTPEYRVTALGSDDAVLFAGAGFSNIDGGSVKLSVTFDSNDYSKEATYTTSPADLTMDADGTPGTDNLPKADPVNDTLAPGDLGPAAQNAAYLDVPVGASSPLNADILGGTKGVWSNDAVNKLDAGPTLSERGNLTVQADVDAGGLTYLTRVDAPANLVYAPIMPTVTEYGLTAIGADDTVNVDAGTTPNTIDVHLKDTGGDWYSKDTVAGIAQFPAASVPVPGAAGKVQAAAESQIAGIVPGPGQFTVTDNTSDRTYLTADGTELQDLFSNTGTGNIDQGPSDPGNIEFQIDGGAGLVTLVRTLVEADVVTDTGKFFYDGSTRIVVHYDYRTGGILATINAQADFTLKSGVTDAIALIFAVYSGKSNSYAYDGTNNKIVLSVAEFGSYHVLTALEADATAYQGTTGAKAVFDAIAAAVPYGQQSGLYGTPFIDAGAVALTNVSTAAVVTIEVASGGGTALAKIRILETESPVADIPSGSYSYTMASGIAGKFGRTLLVGDAFAAGESLKVPWIKAHATDQAALYKIDTNEVVTGTVFSPDHEDAIFQVNTGETLSVGEYWYMTDVAIYKRAVYPGEIYGNGDFDPLGTAPDKGVLITIDPTTFVRILKPDGKGSPNEFDIDITASSTYQDIVVGINSSTFNNVVTARFVADFTHPVTNAAQFTAVHDLVDNTSAPEYLRGGDDGIGKDASYYFTKLQGTQFTTGALTLLENHPVDSVVFLNLYLDETSLAKAFGDRYFYLNSDTRRVQVEADGSIIAGDTSSDVGNNLQSNFGQILAEHCYQTSLNGSERTGILSVRPLRDTSLQGRQARVNELTRTINPGRAIIVDGFKTVNPLDGRVEDIGRYLSVVAFEMISNATNAAVTGEAIFAGRRATLPPQSATTHKPIFNFSGLLYDYSKPQLDTMAGFRYVTAHTEGGISYITDGITAAGEVRQGQASDYTRDTTVRIVHAAIGGMRRVASPFIGEPNSIPHRLALNTAIDEYLRVMVSAGALAGFNFTILASAAMQLIGEIRIELTLQVWGELRRITTTVALSLPSEATIQAAA